LKRPKNFEVNAYGTIGRRSTVPRLSPGSLVISSSVSRISWRLVAYEKFVEGSIFPAMIIGPCMLKPPWRPTIVMPPISMVGAPRKPSSPPRLAMKNASLPRPKVPPRSKYPRVRLKSTGLGSNSSSA
jgi:hypothetical protein